MNTVEKRRPLLPLLIVSVCLLFLGINGLIGGIVMLRDPNGEPFGLSVSVLQTTPFANFLVPGIVLLGVWGVGSLLVLSGLWLRWRVPLLDGLIRLTHEDWPWEFTIVLGVALMIWLIVQVVTIPGVAPIQVVLFVMAALMIVVPLLPQMRQYYHTA